MEETNGQKYAQVVELLNTISMDQIFIGIATWLKGQDQEIADSLMYVAQRELEGRGATQGWTIVIKVKGPRYEVEGRCGEMGFSEGNYGNMNEAFSRAMSYIDSSVAG